MQLSLCCLGIRGCLYKWQRFLIILLTWLQAANASAKGGQSPIAAQKAFNQAVRVASAAERSDAAAAREEAASRKDALAGGYALFERCAAAFLLLPLPVLLDFHIICNTSNSYIISTPSLTC
jgi:hypothetical protein